MDHISSVNWVRRQSRSRPGRYYLYNKKTHETMPCKRGEYESIPVEKNKTRNLAEERLKRLQHKLFLDRLANDDRSDKKSLKGDKTTHPPQQNLPALQQEFPECSKQICFQSSHATESSTSNNPSNRRSIQQKLRTQLRDEITKTTSLRDINAEGNININRESKNICKLSENVTKRNYGDIFKQTASTSNDTLKYVDKYLLQENNIENSEKKEHRDEKSLRKRKNKSSGQRSSKIQRFTQPLNNLIPIVKKKTSVQDRLKIIPKLNEEAELSKTMKEAEPATESKREDPVMTVPKFTTPEKLSPRKRKLSIEEKDVPEKKTKGASESSPRSTVVERLIQSCKRSPKLEAKSHDAKKVAKNKQPGFVFKMYNSISKWFNGGNDSQEKESDTAEENRHRGEEDAPKRGDLQQNIEENVSFKVNETSTQPQVPDNQQMDLDGDIVMQSSPDCDENSMEWQSLENSNVENTSELQECYKTVNNNLLRVMGNKNRKTKWMKDHYYIVVDTNVLLNSLTFIDDLKAMQFCGTTGTVIYIPYRVLQELDKLKMKSSSESIQLRSNLAIKFLNKSFQNKDKIQGQSAAEEETHLIKVSSPDDSILNCCLQVMRNIDNVLFLTEDINLQNKAMTNGIPVSQKSELLSRHLNS